MSIDDGRVARRAARHPGRARQDGPEVHSASRPAGVTGLSCLFAVGALVASLTCLALLLPGPGLDPIWRLNPRAQLVFQSMGAWAPALMMAVAGACALAAIGLWIRARWGHRVAVVLLTVNLAGDTINALVLGDRRTLIGLPIAGLLLGYLLSRNVRGQFVTVSDADRA